MISFSDAKEQREVLLSDGRIGRLQHISRRSRIATIVIGGRRYRLPADEVEVFSTHLPPVDGILPCCSLSVGLMDPLDRISEIRDACSCPEAFRDAPR
jgi:hypothetical protein